MTDYRAKVLKPLILKYCHGLAISPEDRKQIENGMKGLALGNTDYMLADNFIVLGKSPKSQKKIRIAK